MPVCAGMVSSKSWKSLLVSLAMPNVRSFVGVALMPRVAPMPTPPMPSCVGLNPIIRMPLVARASVTEAASRTAARSRRSLCLVFPW
jgi:hypothetical protein